MNNVVLVVDDNAANIFALSTMLRQMGFEGDEGASGVEAINLSCHKNYRLILMDYLMPEMDGIQAIKQIQFIMKGQECPVFIGLSATLDEDVTATFQRVGVDYLMEKPVRAEQLKEMLDQIGISVTGEEEDSPGEEIDMANVLSEIEGLNYEKGIDLMAGSVGNYMKVLKVCVGNIRENEVALDSMKDTGQMRGFALHFHSLKGIFLNIGADELAGQSKALEMAAKEERVDYVESNLDGYMGRVERFARQIQAAWDHYASFRSETIRGGEVSGSEFASQLEELKQHIEDFEYIEITEMLDQMLAGCRDEKREGLQEISDAIQAFDYDLALEAWERLESSL